MKKLPPTSAWRQGSPAINEKGFFVRLAYFLKFVTCCWPCAKPWPLAAIG